MRKVFLFLILAAGQVIAQTSPGITEYIRKYSQLAMEEQIRTGIPAAITLAQGIHESGAGLGELCLSSNNHFGIKCKTGWDGEKVYHDDDESGECFRAYGCVADSYRDHSDFLVNGKRYSFLFDKGVEDYKGWAYGLKQAGYATNPKYPQILIRIIEDNNLASFTSLAMMQEKNASIYMTASNKEVDPVPPVAAVTVENKKEAKNITPKKEEPVVVQYPSYKPGVFSINACKVIYVEAGTTLTHIANTQNIPIKKLLDYNDIQTSDQLGESRLVYLEPKKKIGVHKTYQVKPGESAWTISQQEGIQLKKLLQHNRLTINSSVKPGQVLYLQESAPRS